jgi:twitching motility protein PilT
VALAITPLLSQLNRTGGSDLHLRAGSVPTVRIDGTLHRLEVPALDDEGTLALLLETMPERLRGRYLDGGDVDYAFEPAPGDRLRVNAFHFRGRPAAVLRLVLAKPLRLQDLDLPTVLSDLALRPHGLTLVTGRAGSGKTTTLAAMAEEVNVSRAAHVLTLEDPIEILVPEKMAVVTQREIVSDVETFGTALRSAMRQDPNVIVVGEMRDEETVRAALVAAETGHHVISTLHTTDATSSVHRILDLFPPQEQKQIRVTLAAVLNGVVCQRLVPRADGRGRVAATEVAVNTGLIAEAIADPAKTGSIRDLVADGAYHGMHTFHQDLVRRLGTGVIAWEDARAAATDPHDLEVDVRRAGLFGLTMSA